MRETTDAKKFEGRASIHAFAEAVAADLLTNGFGERADRLVLMVDEPKRDLGGWCHAALTARIEQAMLEAIRRGTE